jgi:hypothetical protein
MPVNTVFASTADVPQFMWCNFGTKGILLHLLLFMELKTTINCLVQFHVITSTLYWSLTPYMCVQRDVEPAHRIYKPTLSHSSAQWLMILPPCSTQFHINAGLCNTVRMTSNMARLVTTDPRSSVLTCIAVICSIRADSIVQNYGPNIPYWAMCCTLHHWNL